jgi:hypothetical protein
MGRRKRHFIMPLLLLLPLCFPLSSSAQSDGADAMTISIRSKTFDSSASATAAMYLATEVLIDGEWEEQEPPPLGDDARLLRRGFSDGAVISALLVTRDLFVLTVVGTSRSLDPTDAVIQAARTQLAAMPTSTMPVTPTSTVTPTDIAENVGRNEELQSRLPSTSALPVTGLDVVEDSSLTEEQLVTALGGTHAAEQNLETWGWSGNATRSYSAADPASLDPSATTAIVISVHGFNSPESAQEALTFFSDILVNSGYEEIDAPQFGDKVRLLKIVNKDRSTNVAVYWTDGDLMYRIGGSAGVGGDPTDVVTQVAQSLLGADTGQ